MKGELYIDGYDARQYFAIVVAEESYKSIICPAKAKKPEHTDWSELNGYDYDLTTINFEPREVKLTLYTDNMSKTDSLHYLLRDRGYHIFNFKSWDIELRLRYKHATPSKIVDGMMQFSLTLEEDMPYNFVGYIGEQGIKYQRYKLAGISLAQYGWTALFDTDKALYAKAKAKDNLTIKRKGYDGVVYDTSIVRYQPLEAKIKLWRCGTPTEILQSLGAIVGEYAKGGEKLFETPFGDWYSSYSSCTIDKLIKTANKKRNRWWCEISVSLNLNPIDEQEGYIVSTEDDATLNTEINQTIITEPT
jgi:hypothetical protein